MDWMETVAGDGACYGCWSNGTLDSVLEIELWAGQLDCELEASLSDGLSDQ
jgi:hypothetical protein